MQYAYAHCVCAVLVVVQQLQLPSSAASVNFYWLIDELRRIGHWCCGWWCCDHGASTTSNEWGPFENGKNLNDQRLLAIHGEFDSMVWLSNRFIHPFIIHIVIHICQWKTCLRIRIRVYEAYLYITLPTVLKSLLFMVHKYCRKKTFGYSDDLVFEFFSHSLNIGWHCGLVCDGKMNAAQFTGEMSQFCGRNVVGSGFRGRTASIVQGSWSLAGPGATNSARCNLKWILRKSTALTNV